MEKILKSHPDYRLEFPHDLAHNKDEKLSEYINQQAIYLFNIIKITTPLCIVIGYISFLIFESKYGINIYWTKQTFTLLITFSGKLALAFLGLYFLLIKPLTFIDLIPEKILFQLYQCSQYHTYPIKKRRKILFIILGMFYIAFFLISYAVFLFFNHPQILDYYVTCSLISYAWGFIYLTLYEFKTQDSFQKSVQVLFFIFSLFVPIFLLIPLCISIFNIKLTATNAVIIACSYPLLNFFNLNVYATVKYGNIGSIKIFKYFLTGFLFTILASCFVGMGNFVYKLILNTTNHAWQMPAKIYISKSDAMKINHKYWTKKGINYVTVPLCTILYDGKFFHARLPRIKKIIALPLKTYQIETISSDTTCELTEKEEKIHSKNSKSNRPRKIHPVNSKAQHS